MQKSEHIERIKKELKEAGVTSYGLIKAESRYLHNVIHENEHIGAAVYGQFDKKGSAMLVATDQRVIFLDRKPLFTTSDELAYYIVSGVRHDQSGLTDTLILHTRIGDYTLRYVNAHCANQFEEYIGMRILEYKKGDARTSAVPEKSYYAPVKPLQQALSNEASAFLRERDIAVLSTVDRSGNVYGSVVYYVSNQNNQVFIVTKSETAKAKNILVSGQVALTIFDASKAQTLNIQGVAEFEIDNNVRNQIFKDIVKPRPYSGELQLPPVTKLTAGSFTVIRITPLSAKYTDYKKLTR